MHMYAMGHRSRLPSFPGISGHDLYGSLSPQVGIGVHGTEVAAVEAADDGRLNDQLVTFSRRIATGACHSAARQRMIEAPRRRASVPMPQPHATDEAQQESLRPSYACWSVCRGLAGSFRSPVTLSAPYRACPRICRKHRNGCRGVTMIHSPPGPVVRPEKSPS